mmetsp:Transcript_10840/g.28225  ORF Transcript_10840/g.28225 Transcript_10840/m.28225 type:complete len:94 (+) Transcript_10840:807-1088(+)
MHTSTPQPKAQQHYQLHGYGTAFATHAQSSMGMFTSLRLSHLNQEYSASRQASDDELRNQDAGGGKVPYGNDVHPQPRLYTVAHKGTHSEACQ